MKRLLRFQGGTEAIEVEWLRGSGSAGSRHTVRRDGHALEVEAEVVSADRGQFRLQGRFFEYYVLSKDRAITVWVGGRMYTFEPVDGTRAEDVRHADVVHESLIAPMPGSILQVKIAAGDRFDAHQPLVIMESMKMEMTLSVPHAGLVRTVHCKAGQMVDMGAVLMALNPVETE